MVLRTIFIFAIIITLEQYVVHTSPTAVSTVVRSTCDLNACRSERPGACTCNSNCECSSLADSDDSDGICVHRLISCTNITHCNDTAACGPGKLCIKSRRCGKRSVCIPEILDNEDLCSSKTDIRSRKSENTNNSYQGAKSLSAFWSFDSNTHDSFNNFNGVPVGRPMYAQSVLGKGASISFTQSSPQYVAILSDQLPLQRSSFTIEMWIYPTSLTNGDSGLFGHCSENSPNMCLHFVIRGLRLHCGFYANDVVGKTVLQVNTWSHVACVYNLITLTQQVWLNGVLDGSKYPAAPFQRTLSITTIGTTYNHWEPGYIPLMHHGFIGYIDEVRFEPRAKTAVEIMRSATYPSE
ncbi:unnamed protein product [Rotaria magnacalcarata]|uniref:Uncharacterized protein n=1 Tax=Rotaria magnacalcarata TaxID=392030 RepID=A0A816Z1F9_9BILA|nr:unnamed protein product [Rotaria magnacalcarata]CAF1651914.1 unnamed protein product [Rotaria magnacalcarata]CAF2172104.1 unnamed protein product [Rotaria magnacalcarata]CAF3887629.1 unnamed protein product [Rotaria magnacalcarata]CAF3900274.1 unnamed protein product [Rotaria magnacalcarata]